MTIDQLNTNIHIFQSDIVNKNRQFFLNKKDFYHPVAQALDNLSSFDFTKFENSNTKFLKDHVLGYWLEIREKMEKDQQLDAILLEYSGSFSEETEALSYGIINWKNYKLSDRPIRMGSDYKFAPGFEVVPTVGMETLDILSPLRYENIEDDVLYESLLPEGTGYFEMVRLVTALSILSLNKIFRTLDEANFFQPLHLQSGCLFLISQHDESVVTPFYIKK
jgi:hypothetical protein